MKGQKNNNKKNQLRNQYKFWFEDEGKKGWTFIIKAKDYNDAYEKAYKTHGPQVENMIYQLIK